MDVFYLSYQLILFALGVYKKIERLLATVFYPLVQNYVEQKLQAAGINLDETGSVGISIKPGFKKEWILRVACDGELGIGETYMEGLWECTSLEELATRAIKSGVYKDSNGIRTSLVHYLQYGLFNMQTVGKAFEVSSHYNLGNDLYEAFLDPSMSYSCAYWKNASNLKDAQIAKLELIAQKLKLSKGMKVLDIGCGWGGLAKYLAVNYGVSVVGVTIGKEGANYARQICAGLDVEIRVVDYRSLDEKFDRIVSIAMFEHVGSKIYREYFQVVHRCLKSEGIFLLHTSGYFESCMRGPIDAWRQKYIFPNAEIPYYTDVMNALEDLFLIEDWHNFGFDYARTLLAWRDNFVSSWPKLESKYGNKFFRMWKYYLEIAAAGFINRKLNLWQLVLSKEGLPNGYDSVR